MYNHSCFSCFLFKPTSANPVHVLGHRPPKNYESRPNWTPTKSSNAKKTATTNATTWKEPEVRVYSSTRPVPQRVTSTTPNRSPPKTVSKGKPFSRLRGVFAGGVQPERIVLVMDEELQYVDYPALRRRGHTLLSASNLDLIGFMNLILEDDSYKQDGVLYVIIPWLGLFLKNLHAFIIEPKIDETTTKTSDTKLSFREKNTSTLLNIVKDFSSRINPVDIASLNSEGTSIEPRAAVERTKDDSEQLYGGRLLAQRLIHSALQLRSAVRDNSLNCDVAFCGFPAHLMDADGAAQLFSKEVCEYGCCLISLPHGWPKKAAKKKNFITRPKVCKMIQI